jgi:mannose-1-phosphate guanylyltransferase/phosphomannomutase
MQGSKHYGYWYDIGNTADYIRANMKLVENPEFSKPTRNKSIRSPSFIGKGCVLHPSVVLGPHSILSDNVTIGRGSTISKSIIFENSFLGDNCRVNGCVIGENVRIGDRAKIGRGAIVSGQIKIPEDSTIKPGSMILHY